MQDLRLLIECCNHVKALYYYLNASGMSVEL